MPSIRTEYGNEANKGQNLYVYCQFLTRFDLDAGPIRSISSRCAGAQRRRLRRFSLAGNLLQGKKKFLTEGLTTVFLRVV